jgi:hypothetical protein
MATTINDSIAGAAEGIESVTLGRPNMREDCSSVDVGACRWQEPRCRGQACPSGDAVIGAKASSAAPLGSSKSAAHSKA